MAKILLLNQGNTHNYGDAANNSFKSLEYLSDKIKKETFDEQGKTVS